MLAKLLFDSRGRQCLQKATCCRKSRHHSHRGTTDVKGEEMEMIPRAPHVPEKKLKTTLAHDTSKAGPDFVSVRAFLSILISFPGVNVLWGKPALPRAPLVSHLSCQPLEMATTSVVSISPGEGHIHAQKGQMPPRKKMNRDRLA